MQGDDADDEPPPERARNLQPDIGHDGDLGAPVPEYFDGLNGEEEVHARRARENLDRRKADAQLVALLAADGFTGPRYDRFVEELVRYAVSVMRGWLYSGYIFTVLAQRGFRLSPDELELEALHRDSELREELATMTVALALPGFRQRALIEGGWTVDGGASITTYFMGACAFSFPNQWRQHCTSVEEYGRAAAVEGSLRIEESCPSVETTVLAELRVADHLKQIKDPKRRLAVMLVLAGYTYAEIADLLGEASERVIEGWIYRWRQKAKRMEEGDDRG